MSIVGIICEYNPFHNGHAMQFDRIRADLGSDTTVVCLMSGNYVQRGEPAIFPKAVRARAAVMCGADLVLELPLTAALSSAEGFAAGGVTILTALGCEYLSFGSESGDCDYLMSIAKANLDPGFDELVREHLASGCSYPTARQRALEQLQSLSLEGKAARPGAVTDEVGPRVSVLSSPNDILAVEYCKAIVRQKSPMIPLPIRRAGSYHAETLYPEAPSATALRTALARPSSGREGCPEGRMNGLSREEGSSDWRPSVPDRLHALFASAPIHTMQAGERACLAILRTLPEEAYRTLPFGSEGLWSKLMKNARVCASTEEILSATKSKRYTHSRLRRMLLCAILGLTESDLRCTPPYVRILAFNERGRAALRDMKVRFRLVNAGETPPDAAYYALERRAGDLYALFSEGAVDPAETESFQRVTFLHAKEPPSALQD